MRTLFTIGHSNQSLEEFIALLVKQSVERLVDVRSNPYSTFVPHFNREAVSRSLQGRGIEYLYLGDELGGYPESAEYYAGDRVAYERIANSPAFRRGIKKVAKDSERYSLVLMCAQENPEKCHRHPLLAQTLMERGLQVLHLRGDGSVQDAASIIEATTLQMPLFEPEGEDLTWQSPEPIRRRSHL